MRSQPKPRIMKSHTYASYLVSYLKNKHKPKYDLHRLLKVQGRGWGVPPYGLLVREVPKAPKTIQAIATVGGCPPELDSRYYY